MNFLRACPRKTPLPCAANDWGEKLKSIQRNDSG
jgi:hypothetical protein